MPRRKSNCGPASSKLKRSIDGEAYRLGDYIDCDAIIPVRYCIRPTQDILKTNCLTMIDPAFPMRDTARLIIVAGRDFGRGSANENAVLALMLNKIKAVVAESVSRLFRRNAINLGLPTFGCSFITKNAQMGDPLRIDTHSWTVTNLASEEVLPLRPMSELEREILFAGGLVPYIKRQREVITT